MILAFPYRAITTIKTCCTAIIKQKLKQQEKTPQLLETQNKEGTQQLEELKIENSKLKVENSKLKQRMQLLHQ